MPLEVQTITGKFEHKGDVIVTGDIKIGANITVTNGYFIVNGNVEDLVKITLCKEVVSPGIFSPPPSTLRIKGKIGKNCELETFAGNIHGTTVDEGTRLITHNGDIHLSQIETSVVLNALSGSSYVNNVQQPQHSSSVTINDFEDALLSFYSDPREEFESSACNQQ